MIMELLFHTRWWDYSKYKFNLAGRVSLIVSLFWGVLALLMLHVIQPGIDFIIRQIPKSTGEIIGYILIPVFILDITASAITSVKFDRLLARLQNLRQDMTEYIEGTRIYETGEELVDRISGLRLLGVFSEVKNRIEGRVHNPVPSIQSRLNIKEKKPEMSKNDEFFGRIKHQACKAHIVC
jgi:uncharacterized membrane protein